MIRFPASLARWLPAISVAVLLAMLIAGLLVPLYTDEVGWRLQERAGIDGVDKLFSEQCGPGTLAVPPWFMMPVRWYSAFFNTAWPSPFAVRLSGVGYALAWVALLLLLIRRLAADRQRRDRLTMLGCGLMGLGVMPWLFVWSRPEQPIMLAATSAILVGLPGRQGALRWWAPPAVLVLATIAMSYHFKALVLVPLFLAAIFTAIPLRRGWLVQIPCALALSAMAAVSAHDWRARLLCPGDAATAAEHASQSLGLQLLTQGGWIMAPLRLLANYKLAIYMAQGAPDVTPMSNWLPPYLVTRSTQTGWTVMLILFWLAGFALAVWAMVAASLRRRPDAPLVLAWMALAGASAWCMGQVVRNSYEASFVLPLLVLTFVLALSRGDLPEVQARALRLLAPVIAAVLPLSALAVLAIYGPSLMAAMAKGGYLPGQPHSVGLGHYGATRHRIEQVAAACGITQASHPRRLLLDDVSYFAFMQASLPDHKTGVLDRRYSGSLKDPLAYLAARGSSGMVLACDALPPDLRRRARGDGQVCCLGPAQWSPPAR